MANAIYVPKSDILDLITEENEAGGFTDYSNYSNLWDEVDGIPAADVQPIIYAHKTINVGRRSYCNNCGKLAIMEDFCSKCGAKVKDGDTNE